MRKLFIQASFALFIFASFFINPGKIHAAGNLIQNPDFETGSSAPVGWIKGRWGQNSATFTYPAPGLAGSKAAQVTLSNYASGDAKWAFDHVPITPGKVYEYGDSYTASVPSVITAEIELSNGNTSYVDLAQLPATSGWQTNVVQFTAPPGAVSVSVFHLINQPGTLTIDGTRLLEAVPPNGNLILNPSLENQGPNETPDQWFTGRFGTNTTTFTYPTTAHSGSRAAGVHISSYVSGDAKWYFKDVPVTAGQAYRYSDYSKATITSYITLRFQKADGSFSYLDLGTQPAHNTWTQFSAPFTVPADVVSLTVFHLIKGVGSLDIDSVSLTKITNDPTKFDQGYVSLNFDDGWLSVYENALPILDAAGFKSDQYITTNYMSSNFTGYVKPEQVLDMQARGHEIGAHTRSHSDLATLTPAEQWSEIAGSKADLESIGIQNVSTFAYPFGSYNNQVKNMVISAGFIGARSSDGGANQITQDRYALRRFSLVADTTFANVKSAIDDALANKTWLILLFHEVNNSGHQYSVTPELLQRVVDYLKSENITPITNSEGIAKLQ